MNAESIVSPIFPTLQKAVSAVPHGDAAAKAAITKEVFPGDNGFIAEPYRTFSGITNLFSRTYSFRFDTAMAHSPQNAIIMRHDAYFAALIDERTIPLSRWEWQVETDEDDKALKDGKDQEREDIRRHLSAIVRRTKRFAHMREYLREAPWSGKYGSQVVWGEDIVGGFRRKVIVNHSPVDGDKILIDFDGHPAVAIYGGDLGRYPADAVGEASTTTTDRFPVLKLNVPSRRERFIIAQYRLRDGDYFDPNTAGRVGGIGLRHYCYWAWWLRDEMLAWATDFMEKVGSLGVMLFYYEEGNKSQENHAIAAAKKVGNGNALAVPIPRGDKRAGSVDLIPANLSGVQFLTDFIGNYFEGHIERLLVGQKMSGDHTGSGGLGGSGAASFAMDTKYNLLASDAELHSVCYTDDLLRVAQRLNFPACPWKYYFKLIVPKPDSDKKLEAVTKAVSLGVDFEEDDVRELTGMPKPPEGSKTTLRSIKQAEQQRQQQAELGKAIAYNAPGQLANAPELIGAMLKVGDNPAAVEKLSGLAEDPQQMQSLIGPPDDDAKPEGGDISGDKPPEDPKNPGGVNKTTSVNENENVALNYAWMPGTSATGHVKAIGTGEHEGRTLYGEDAERALKGHEPKADDTTPKDSSAKTPVPDQANGGAKATQHDRMNAALAVLDNPTAAKPEDVAGLAKHLKGCDAKTIRGLADRYFRSHQGLKADLIAKLVQYATGTSNGQQGPTYRDIARQTQQAEGDATKSPPSPAPEPSATAAGMEQPAKALGDSLKPAEPAAKQPDNPTPDYVPSTDNADEVGLDVNPPEADHPVHATLNTAIGNAGNVTQEKAAHYRASLAKVMTNIPKAVKDKLQSTLKKATFQPDATAIGKATIEDAWNRPGQTEVGRQKLLPYLKAFTDGRLKAGASYNPKTGAIHLDGDLGEDYPTHEVYAHALGHAINGPDKAVSNSPEWQYAWQSEIRGGKLNRYATKSASEGMAEFARLVYGSGKSADEIRQQFPKSAAAFEKHGLIEASGNQLPAESPSKQVESEQAAPGTGNQLPGGITASAPTFDPQSPVTTPTAGLDLGGPVLPDMFGERVDVDGDDAEGAHVDVLHGKPVDLTQPPKFKSTDLEGQMKELNDWHKSKKQYDHDTKTTALQDRIEGAKASGADHHEILPHQEELYHQEHEHALSEHSPADVEAAVRSGAEHGAHAAENGVEPTEEGDGQTPAPSDAPAATESASPAEPVATLAEDNHTARDEHSANVAEAFTDHPAVPPVQTRKERREEMGDDQTYPKGELFESGETNHDLGRLERLAIAKGILPEIGIYKHGDDDFRKDQLFKALDQHSEQPMHEDYSHEESARGLPDHIPTSLRKFAGNHSAALWAKQEKDENGRAAIEDDYERKMQAKEAGFATKGDTWEVKPEDLDRAQSYVQDFEEAHAAASARLSAAIDDKSMTPKQRQRMLSDMDSANDDLMRMRAGITRAKGEGPAQEPDTEDNPRFKDHSDAISRAIADAGGPDSLTVDSIEAIRRKLYTKGQASPTQADIRDAAESMREQFPETVLRDYPDLSAKAKRLKERAEKDQPGWSSTGETHPALAHLDPKAAKDKYDNITMHSNSHAMKVRDAETEVGKLKDQLRINGSRQPEKKKLQKALKEAEKKRDEASNEQGRWNRQDGIWKAGLEGAAVDEKLPLFIRIAAADEAGKGARPRTDISGMVKDYLNQHGHDPRVADAVASEVMQYPMRAASKLDEVIRGEEHRQKTYDERKEAKEHIKSLDMEPHHVANAEREADKLHAGDFEHFKQKWSGHAIAGREQQAKNKAAEQAAKERGEMEQAVRKAADDHIAAMRAGKPTGTPSPEVLHELAGRAVDAHAQWHAGTEMPKAQSGKDIVTAVGKETGQRFNLGQFIPEQGWATDTKYAVKATPEMIEHSKKLGYDKREGRVPKIADILPKPEDIKAHYKPAEIVATRHSANHELLLKTADGETQVHIDGQYLANIKKLYPDANVLIRGSDKPLVLMSKGEQVGLIMPLANGSDDTDNYEKGKRLELGDVLAPGPYSAAEAEKSSVGGHVNGLRVGRGEQEARLWLGGKHDYRLMHGPSNGEQIGTHSFSNEADAIKAGKELLAHAHGMDDEGRLIFKPKGEKTELSPLEKARQEYLTQHGERIAAAMKVKPVKREDGAEAIPVGDHWEVRRGVNAKGKPDGWDVHHGGTGLKAESWTTKNNAIGHAIALGDAPGVNWGEYKGRDETDPDKLKQFKDAHKKASDAFENNELPEHLKPKGNEPGEDPLAGDGGEPFDDEAKPEEGGDGLRLDDPNFESNLKAKLATGQKVELKNDPKKTVQPLNAMHQEDFDALAPAMLRHVDKETNPRKKFMAAASTIHGLAPALQSAMVAHLADHHPDAVQFAHDNPGQVPLNVKDAFLNHTKPTDTVESPAAKAAVKPAIGDIYPVNVKGRGVMHAVRESENGAGDTLHATEDDAKAYKTQADARKAAKDIRDKAAGESKAKQDEAESKAKAERDDLDGFGDGMTPLARGKAAEALAKQYKFNGQADTLKNHIRKMVENGAELTQEDVDRIQPMSKMQSHRATNEEQAAHEQRIKDGGKKTIHRVNGYDLGKIAHDYAKHLSEKKGPQEQPAAPTDLASQIAAIPHDKDVTINGQTIRRAGADTFEKLRDQHAASNDQQERSRLMSEIKWQEKHGSTPAKPKAGNYSKGTPSDYNHADLTGNHEHWKSTHVPEGHVGVTVKTPDTGDQAYVARLKGFHPQYGFDREFIGGPPIPNGERATFHVPDGLYEAKSSDKLGGASRHYFRARGGRIERIRPTEINHEMHMELNPVTPGQHAGDIPFQSFAIPIQYVG